MLSLVQPHVHDAWDGSTQQRFGTRGEEGRTCLQVLACALIRMALAESFCASCGVIALDEPTTNLDMANSAALAQALRSILDMRSNLTHETDRVFQLIVITHDENFATQLGAHDYCEFMTRVTKDENNHTKLTEEPID